MTATASTDQPATKSLRRIRGAAAFLLICGVTTIGLSVLVQAERAAVQISSYSKLVEMQHRELISVPTGDELSFSRPQGDLRSLHADIFPSNSVRTYFHGLTVLGVATTLSAGLVLHFARASNFSASGTRAP